MPGKDNLFYFGATGGGVWRTKDGGGSWENISDGYFGGSIGAVAVSEWDNNVIYVGGGEKTIRGNVSHGYGMWKSLDAGKTWSHIGLDDSRHIARIRIHPKNPDLVYAAVMGHLFGPNEERGVYRSSDGGETWENIHYVSDKAGAVDLQMDPTNPRVLYASMWEFNRSPYSMSSGGEDSGLWKSTDGGDTWQGSAVSLWTHAQDMVEACKALGVDVMTGHWEFTYGMERVKEIVEKDFAGKIDFVAQNVKTADFGDPVFKPYVIREINGVPCAIIGQAFPYTPIANPRYMVADWEFGIQDQNMQAMVDEARGKGAQVVVVLSHNGMDVDLKMASRVRGIDAILG
ncbi:MAG: hypothetical protein EBR20_09670, partial [Bacteroidetes bacterium]|nr:hypothetical protein [Bacteroidota bacterium]